MLNPSQCMFLLSDLGLLNTGWLSSPLILSKTLDFVLYLYFVVILNNKHSALIWRRKVQRLLIDPSFYDQYSDSSWIPLSVLWNVSFLFHFNAQKKKKNVFLPFFVLCNFYPCPFTQIIIVLPSIIVKAMMMIQKVVGRAFLWEESLPIWGLGWKPLFWRNMDALCH